jgi:cardiolipin synthase
MTAAKSDNNATIAAARHCYQRLLKRGVEVLEYGATKLHTKLFVVDDAVHLGSANFDVRSLFLNLELMLRIDDAAFAEHVRGYFEAEAGSATRITQEAHAKAGFIQRIQWSLAYFIVRCSTGTSPVG